MVKKKLFSPGKRFNQQRMSTYGGAFSTETSICPAGCSVTGTLPSVATGPFASILHTATADSGTEKLYVDRFSI